MDITFKGQHTDVNERFRLHATGKLAKFGRMDQQVSRIDVEVCVERNPRLASLKERVELTVRAPGPAIRAEAAAEDRFAALDLALARLESRLRRALDRRKNHKGGKGVRLVDVAGADEMAVPAQGPALDGAGAERQAEAAAVADELPIPADGDPLYVRQKFHQAGPITIDQALFQMELVGHDFYLFRDIDGGMPCVVYRRRGYQYGVIRLVDEPAAADADAAGSIGRRGRARANGRPDRAAARPGRRRASADSRAAPGPDGEPVLRSRS